MMDMNNNNLNNNFDPNSNINQTYGEIKSNTISIGAIIGLIVLVGTILIVVNMTTNVVTKFNALKTKAEQMFPGGLEEAFGGELDLELDDDIDISYDDGNNVTNGITNPEAYAKHKDIVWCGTSDTYKGFTVYIENGQVYSKDSAGGSPVKWATVGTPKKIHLNPPSAEAYMVTEEGKVYYVYYDTCEQITDLDKYNIIDMAYLNNYTYEYFYFLTSDGKLIDGNGNSYYKYNFVGRVEFDKMLFIPIDGKGYAYHSDNEIYEEVPIVDEKGYKIVVSKIYSFSGYALLESTDGKLYKYDGESKVAKLESDKMISRVEKNVTAKKESIVVTFIDTTTKEYESPLGVYDVKNNKEIPIEEVSDKIDNTNNIGSNIDKLSNVLQQTLWNVYNAKTLTGSEVLAAFQQYQNTDVSIIIKTNEKGSAYTGKYKLDENLLKIENKTNSKTASEHKPYENGVFYLNEATKFDSKIKRTEFIKLWNEYQMNAGQTFYSSLIRDELGNVFGIVFMEKK